MAGIDYRALQAPENVSTDLPDNGAVARARELEQTFKEFGGLAHEYGTKVATEAGALAGAASGNTGHPDYQEGLRRFTAYGQAFNNAATGAYAIQAEAQANDSAARLRVQANNDPATFQATYTAVRDAVLKNAPAQAQPMLAELYNRRLAEGMGAISGDQAAEQRKLQRAEYDSGIEADISQVANLQSAGTPEGDAAAADQWVKLSAKINGGVNAGLYSAAEGQATMINAHTEVTSQVFESQVNKELARPDGKVEVLLNNFRNAHLANMADPSQPPVLSEKEFQGLMQKATTKIQEYRLMQSMEKEASRAAEQAKYEEGDRVATGALFDHTLTVKMLGEMDLSKDLHPATGRALYNMLETNAANGKGNSVLAFKLHNDPSVLDMKPADIMRYVGPGGLNGTQAETLAAEIERRNSGWEGTQQFKQAAEKLAVAFKIPPGVDPRSLDEETAKAYALAHAELVQTINNTDPSKRMSLMDSAVQTTIAHVHQREAAAQVISLRNDMKQIEADHGPGTSVPWSKDKFDLKMKEKAAAIAVAQAAAKGP